MELELLEKKTAVEIGGLIEIGKICPIELTDFYLNRINDSIESKSLFTTVIKRRSLKI